MKRFHSQALVSAWNIRGPCRETQYTNPISPLRTTPLYQPWHFPRIRFLTTTATAFVAAEPNRHSDETKESGSLSLPDQIRLLMRRVPYPVAIITATDPHGPLDKSFRGMTVSSFNTVTLHPSPIISFNVRRPSETLAALLASQRFLIHLLSPHAATAALARDFSRGNHNLAIMAGKSEFEFTPLKPCEDEKGHARPLPLLGRKDSDQESFPFVFECRVLPQRVDVQDHTIVVGTVVKTLSSHRSDPSPTSENETSSTSAADLCLTYANTRFWEMGHEI